jgi:hypothetical protein
MGKQRKLLPVQFCCVQEHFSISINPEVDKEREYRQAPNQQYPIYRRVPSLAYLNSMKAPKFRRNGQQEVLTAVPQRSFWESCKAHSAISKVARMTIATNDWQFIRPRSFRIDSGRYGRSRMFKIVQETKSVIRRTD